MSTSDSLHLSTRSLSPPLIDIVECLAEHMNQAVIVFSKTAFLTSNLAGASLLGESPSGLRSGNPADFFPPEDWARFWNETDSMATQASIENPLEVGINGGTKSARKVPCSICKKIGVDGEPAVLLAFTDESSNSDSKNNEPMLADQVWQAQKMEAMGTLAGGVAHDMNNVLGAIMSLASVLRQEAADDDPRNEDLDDILAATRRGRDLTQNLLGFARKGNSRKELISLNHVAGQVQELLSRTIHKNIEWRLKLIKEIPSIRGDYGQLTHALMNITINAADAMPSGGVLTLKTGVLSPERDGMPRVNLKNERYVTLSVSDTGVGMDEATSARAFEPFFSTKKDNEGTGLGLAMALGTAQKHGGEVHIESAPNRGTTVTLYLPAAKVKRVDKRTSPNLRPVGTIGTGRVLVVDDEELIRRSAKRVLETIGYTTIFAINGLEAVEIFEKNRDVVLVVLDLTMPVMDGEETFHRIKAIDANVPILLLSGHALEGNAEELLAAGATAFVQKPFDLHTLARGILISIPI